MSKPRCNPMRIFQSTLLMRGATRCRSRARQSANFNPRSSCEERPGAFCGTRKVCWYFNPRSSCEERLIRYRDDVAICQFQSTLLMRGATASRHCKMLGTEFQSTLLMRGATCACSLRSLAVQNFNPRSSCEERLGFLQASGKSAHISIHAPHARSDGSVQIVDKYHSQFQSTLLMRGATRKHSR